MFVKLTRLDNTPIWINASFVVTVEPHRGGGAVVVPIGDGLDYDVRESPERVLALLDGAPQPAVVPVPPPKALAATATAEAEPPPEFAQAADPDPAPDPAPVVVAEEEPRPARRAHRTKKAADGAEADAPKPPRKTTRTKSKKASLELSDEQLERLRKMAPGSTRKLLNTLVTQFNVPDADSLVAALQEHAVIEVDREHIVWK